MAQRSPDTLASTRRVLFDKRPKVPRKYTPIEALSLLLSQNLSKKQYLAISKGASAHYVDLYPGYNRVAQAKLVCRPPATQLFIDEGKAEVLIQDLLDHTANRIAMLQENVISQFISTYQHENCEFELICSWGCDGSSDHSIYRNKCTSYVNDGSLFATCMTPLRLQRHTGNGQTVIIWNNLTPQSPRFGRPIRLQFQKESEELVLHEIEKMESEISTLQPCYLQLEGIAKEIRINFIMLMTMIDGKVLNYKTKTSSQSCPICNAKPSQFNILSNNNASTSVFTPNAASLQHGISPLHAWIRLLECCLHISYRLVFDPPIWRIPGGKNNAALKERKHELQRLLIDQLQIRVDFVKPGAGTTNNGNAARIAFRNYEKFAEILGLDVLLVKNFRTILIAISCQLPIDPVLFGNLCKNTAELYVQKYNWYPMPPTLHKILIHGSQILTNSILPLGMLGEDALEARNKYYRKFRLDHARKSSRRDNMEDMFLRTMDTSDPILSSIELHMRLKKRNRLTIPKEVLELLLVPEAEEAHHSFEEQNEEEDKDHEDDDDDDVDYSCVSDVIDLLKQFDLESEDV